MNNKIEEKTEITEIGVNFKLITKIVFTLKIFELTN